MARRKKDAAEEAFAEQMAESKRKKKAKKRSKRGEIFDMYDMIIANMVAGNSLIEPSVKLDNSQICIGFSNVASDSHISKYFMVAQLPDYMPPRFIDQLRMKCAMPGVRIDVNFYCVPHIINWDSAEMRNKMAIWKDWSSGVDDNMDAFSYRARRSEVATKQRIITSTRYLNEAELEYRRKLMKVSIIIKISARRDEESILYMMDAIDELKSFSIQNDIRLRELRINMIDWLRMLSPFSLIHEKEVYSRFTKKIMTDDLLANFNSYKQGRVGYKGVPLGIDVKSNEVVVYDFKEDPEAACNWIISAETGGGKSFWIKVLLSFLLADGFVVSVMDYEGDEYTPLANYVRAGNPKDVKVVSLGKGDTTYFDPCPIPDLTGDPEVDSDLKDGSISFITAIFRTICCGMDGDFTREESKIMSLAIRRMYETQGVTDDPSTWSMSKDCKLYDVYFEIKEMMETKEFLNEGDESKQAAVGRMADALSIYFEEGEAKANTFKTPMDADELYAAKLIVFSFGMKGEGANVSDPVLLALKQLSVAYINIKISNYTKYVKHKLNIKVWEEFQRWGDIKGSTETILNAITGGRKRGDRNFIITNTIASLLDQDNKLALKLRPNIQHYAIGKIPDKSVREEFCTVFEKTDCLDVLGEIANANTSKRRLITSGRQNRYRNAFCVMLASGERATVKVMLPPEILESKLFSTGVKLEENEDEV